MMILAAIASLPFAAQAQDGAEVAVDTSTSASLKALQDRAALIEARAKIDKDERDRITALGIPSFAGTAEMKQSAGNLEAGLLSTAAIEQAATTIADVTKGQGQVIVLAGAETFDLGIASAMATEMDAIKGLFIGADNAKPGAAPPKIAIAGVAGAIAIANVAAGLFRSEVSVTAAEVKIDDATLAAAVAGRIVAMSPPPAKPVVYLPSQASGVVPTQIGLVATWSDLAKRRGQAVKARALIGDKPDPAQAPWAAALDAAIAAYDSFTATATKVDATGTSPLIRAARLESLKLDDAAVLRVYAVLSGGSLVITKNIGTTFGADPLKVSGGLVARYTLAKIASGQALAAGVIACRTSLVRLLAVHNAIWRVGSQPPAIAQCKP